MPESQGLDAWHAIPCTTNLEIPVDKPSNHSLIHSAMKHLIDEGRITGVTPDLKLDGEPFLAEGDDQYDPTPVTNWREDNFSSELSPWGGRQVKGVEEIRADLLRNGDARNQRIAAALPQFYVRLDDADEFDAKQNYMARENHNYVYMNRSWAGLEAPAISNMSEWSARFLDKKTGEPVYDYHVNPGDYNIQQANPGPGIPNHRLAVIKGGKGWTADQITEWAKKWVGQYQSTNKEPDDTIGSGIDNNR